MKSVRIFGINARKGKLFALAATMVFGTVLVLNIFGTTQAVNTGAAAGTAALGTAMVGAAAGPHQGHLPSLAADDGGSDGSNQGTSTSTGDSGSSSTDNGTSTSDNSTSSESENENGTTGTNGEHENDTGPRGEDSGTNSSVRSSEKQDFTASAAPSSSVPTVTGGSMGALSILGMGVLIRRKNKTRVQLEAGVAELDPAARARWDMLTRDGWK